MPMTTAAAIHGPHSRIPAASAQERLLAQLFDRLWDIYRRRVAYVQTYEQVIQSAGATFVNDHIAFRTFASQSPLSGIASLSRIFEALGYRAAGAYHFEEKHLSALHFQHPNSQFPKLFISELKTWELPAEAQGHLDWALAGQRPAISADALRALHQFTAGDNAEPLLAQVLDYVCLLPWELPQQATLEALNKVSQYAAWTLVHGYNVNHFTSLVNSHGVDAIGDLEKTIGALKGAGVPMKAEIEGEAGSKLRQSATEAVTIDVNVLDDQGRVVSVPWTYAYFELAERNQVVDAATGKTGRFEGFLGPQATNLFEMTRVK
jgi:hypothetical protein